MAPILQQSSNLIAQSDTQNTLNLIYLVILMIFVGIELISHVPSVLHTPLMSGANAIHGVVLIGAIIVMGNASPDDTLSLVFGTLAVFVGTLNVIGGFVVTDRMLEMFKKKPKGGNPS
ncbi:MAG: pyridine nucleotide transhydrogenase [Flavobacteriales bacterium]|nr:MAG: pyridine nucleotide transhydrogenase [Flavobacteriales bacterium]